MAVTIYTPALMMPTFLKNPRIQLKASIYRQVRNLRNLNY